MKIDSIYLTSEKGVTTTSANHLANVAKEILKETETKLDMINFINSNVELINGTQKELVKGMSDISDIISNLNRIANMHSFIAWMREGIKAKDNLLSKISSYSVEDYCHDNDIEYPEAPEQFSVTDLTIIGEMNVKERQRYLMLEAFAAAYGQYIHPSGTISTARAKMYEKVNEPSRLIGSGRDAIIYTYEPSLKPEEVEKMFLELQSKHRGYEKELNAMKFKIKEEVNKRNLKLLQDYNGEYADYRKKVEDIRNKTKEYILKTQEEISKLKIVIPNELLDTFSYLESLG